MSEMQETETNEWLKTLQELPYIGKLFVKRPKVSCIRLSGLIADHARTQKNISYEKYAKLIDKAFEKADQAVALIINSPGGSAAQSALIAEHIRRKAEETELPVYGFVEDVAASGGYWLACAADEIYAQQVSIVGSIGVISASFGFQELIERYGIERRMYTAGKEKSFMDPFLEEKKDDVKRLKVIQNDLHDAFKHWVKERRGERLSNDEGELFEGQFWTGRVARELGIIDGIASPYTFLKDRFGKEVKLISFDPAKSMWPSFLPFAALADEMVSAVEARILKGRYGL